MRRSTGPIIRIPLQTGGVRLNSLAVAGLMSSGAVIAAILVTNVQPAGGFLVLDEAMLFPLLWLVFSWRLISAGRATDLLVSREGVWTEGVRHSPYATLAPWVRVASDEWRYVQKRKSWNLVVGSDAEVVAEARLATEKWSLLRIVDVLGATASRYAGRARGERAVEPSLLHCSNCGAPAPADDSPAVQCRFCGGTVAVPADVRERIRAARRLRHSAGVAPAQIQRLLDQPGALRANLTVLLAAPVMLLAFPLAGVAALLLASNQQLDFLRSAALVMMAGATMWGAFLFGASAIDERRGLQHAALRLGAAGGVEQELCRNCSAPLPLDSGQQVAACRYCGAPNLLGIDLRAEAQATLEDESDLAAELRLQLQRRRSRYLQIAAAAFVFLLFAASFAVGV